MPGAPFVISSSPSRQANPDVAFDGGNFVVVYSDENYAYQSIVGARVDSSGRVLDPNGRLLVTGNSTYYYSDPKIGSDGTDLLMIYKNVRLSSGYVYGQRLDRDLNKLGSSFFINQDTTGSKANLRLAFDGTNYLVCWIKGTTFTASIIGRLVSKPGVPQGSEIVIASGLDSRACNADLTYNGTNYLLTYSAGTDIKGQYIGRSGQLVGSSFTVASAANGVARPAAGFGVGRQLVTYGKKPSTEYDIYGTFVLAAVEEDRTAGRMSRPRATLYAGHLLLDKDEVLYDHAGRMTAATQAGVYFVVRKDGSVRKAVRIR